MKLSEVPQDRGMIEDGKLEEICYAVDENGRYILAPSAGWEPKNIVNDQAWDVIRDQVASAVSGISSGRLSPLAYHMAKNQMNVGLLAKYVKYNRLRVWLHLKPKGFRRLTPDMRKRYAAVFNLTVEELETVPDVDSV